ncbi:hypothetical protein GQ53DRAFT_856454, partial [Thozetella sp. PMI_491]
AHRIRNRSSELFKSVSALHSSYRWCLTGTPIQNSLDDYAALLSFVQVPGLSTKQQFDAWIAKPLQRNSLFAMENLQCLVQATCLRRTKDLVQTNIRLPKRHEKICEVKLTAQDRELYDFFRSHAYLLAAGQLSAKSDLATKATSHINLLTLINILRRICDHGTQMIPSTALTVDLTAACDVHILEPQWNPMAEDQAASRVHRIGQMQEVVVTRYVTANSIEEVYYLDSCALREVLNRTQYIQLIQEQKRRLASQALGSRHISQHELDEERSQVCPFPIYNTHGHMKRLTLTL